MRTAVQRVRSRDGTTIAYDLVGTGEPIILVDGALCTRSLGPMSKLAPLLARHFTVFTYDRRGRGDSGDTAPYAVEREVEDITALVNAAGGRAFAFGISSGGVLALEAANRTSGIKKVALYEAPLIVDGSRPPIGHAWARIQEAIAAGRRGEAVTIFLKSVGTPAPVVAVMRLLPIWSKLTAVAHTLPYDGAIVQDHQNGTPLPAGQWASATMPTLAMVGGSSPVWMRNTMRALAAALPNAQYRELAGLTHTAAAKPLAPVLQEFFAT